MKNEVRPIDANALKLKIREYMSDYKGSPTRLAVCRAVLSMLGDEGQTPTLTDHFRDPAKRAQQDTAWISVKDWLPESGIPVLIYNPHWNYGVVANYAGCGVWMDSYKQRMTYTPTHWHPLPEPPKED